MKTREYIIDFFKRRFDSSATEDQIVEIGKFLNNVTEEDEHRLYQMCKIVDGYKGALTYDEDLIGPIPSDGCDRSPEGVDMAQVEENKEEP